MSTNNPPVEEAEGVKHATRRKSLALSKSPSLQLLRRLHQPAVGLNDVSISSDDGDWDSDPTVVHRRSVASSCRTSRCSSVMSTTLDWEEVQRELASVSAEADAMGDDGDTCQAERSAAIDRSRSPLKRQLLCFSPGKKIDEVDDGQSHETEMSEECHFANHEEATQQGGSSGHNDLANRIFVRNFSKSTTEQDLHKLFSEFGTVSYIRLIKGKKSRKSPRRALVQFDSIRGVAMIMEKLASSPSSFILKERKLNIEIAKPYKQRIYFNELPVELLHHTFQFLTMRERIRIETVCKLWRTVCTDGTWRVPVQEMKDLVVACKPSDAQLSKALDRCGTNMRRLDLSQAPLANLSYRATAVVANHCPQLEQVNLSGIPVTNYSLRLLGQSCSKLTVVFLQHCDFNDQGLWWILHCCRNLQKLSIAGCSNAVGSCFSEINSKVKSLNFNSCILKSKALLGLIHCDAIEELVLDSCIFLSNAEGIFELFERICGSLKKISLRKMDYESIFHTFLKTVFPNLEELVVAHNRKVTDQLLVHVAQHCSKLRYLNLMCTSVTRSGLKHLKDCMHLVDLDISRIVSVINMTVCSLVMHRNFIRLSLSDLEAITDEACFSIADHCLNLAFLDVGGCVHLTNAVVDAFVESYEIGAREIALDVIAQDTCITEFIQLPNLKFWNCELPPRQDDLFEFVPMF